MADPKPDPQAFSIEDLSSMLEEAAIDHEIQENSAIYATGYPFNIWLKIDAENKAIMLSSYWPFPVNLTQQEALAYANNCNCERIMVQFSVPDAWHRLWGHYWLSYRDGLTRKTLLRCAQKFSCIFQATVNDGIRQRVLNDGSDDCATILN